MPHPLVELTTHMGKHDLTINENEREIRRIAAHSNIDTNSELICWTRMQTEAGQPLEDIIARKERERRLGNGKFLWGVGNAPAILSKVLARCALPVPVTFSVMKSRPKKEDIKPSRTVVWRRYIDATGVERAIPKHSFVTSRGDSNKGSKKYHFALMCRSDVPLKLNKKDRPFYPASYRNAGGTGAPVGASQVTALLKRVSPDPSEPPAYNIDFEAWLTDSYWVKLTDPKEISHEVLEKLYDPGQLSDRNYLALLSDVRSDAQQIKGDDLEAPLLLSF